MLLSVILPYYNISSEMFERCLSSLNYSEKYRGKVEIIVVNDGSPTNPDEILAKPEFAEIKCIKQDNQGLACARNTGIRAASGSFIYFMDPDDFLSDNAFDAILNWVDANEKKENPSDLLKFAFRRRTLLNSLEKITDLNCVSHFADKYFLNHNMPCQVWQYVVRRSLITEEGNEVLFMPHILNEDELWTVRMMRKVSRLDISKTQVYNYVINPNSIMHDSSNVERYNESWAKIAEEFGKMIKDETLPYFCEIRIRKAVLARLYLMIRWQKLDTQWKEEYISALKANSLYPFKLTKDGFNFRMRLFAMLANNQASRYLLYKFYRKK